MTETWRAARRCLLSRIEKPPEDRTIPTVFTLDTAVDCPRSTCCLYKMRPSSLARATASRQLATFSDKLKVLTCRLIVPTATINSRQSPGWSDPPPAGVALPAYTWWAVLVQQGRDDERVQIIRDALVGPVKGYCHETLRNSKSALASGRLRK